MKSFACSLAVFSVLIAGCAASVSLEQATEEASPYLEGQEVLFASRGVD